MCLKFLYFLILSWILPRFLIGQKISQQFPDVKGDTIIIHYNLEGVVPNQVFIINVYTSYNDSEPVKYVSGVVGPGIKPGENKIIIWQAKKEIRGFKGKLTINLQATVQFTPLENLKLSAYKKLKRGKSYDIFWQGGEYRQPLKIDLIKNDQTIFSSIIPNDSGYAKLDIPKRIKPAKNYILKLSMTSSPNNYTQINGIIIKRKMPVVLSIGIIATSIATAYCLNYIFNNNSSESNIPDQVLPFPPPHPTD